MSMNTPIFEDRQHKSDDPTQAFKVPEGYFDQLSSSIMTRIRTEEQEIEESSARRPLMEVIRPYLYLAAMFVGLVLIINLIPYVNQLAGHGDTSTTMAIMAPSRLSADVEITDEDYQLFLWEETEDEFIASSVSDSH